MGTRQYIGARYVPKFYQNSVDGSTQWQANVVYEPLVWVTLQNSHMYISKKQVPATVGTPAENIDYWLDIGSYNGIIEGIENDIEAIENNISDIEEDIESLTARVNRKFVFIGDSYAFGFLPGGDEVHPDTTGFYQRVVNSLGLTSSEYTIVAYGRSGFAAQGVNGKTWVQDLADLSSDEDVTDVYVMGGLNDLSYLANDTLYNAIVTFIGAAKTKFPNANIKIGFCGRQSVTNVFDDNTLKQGIQVYKTAALLNNASYLVGSENVLKGVHGAMASDNYHPSNTGQDMLSFFVKNDILTGTPFIYNYTQQNVPITYNKAATGGLQIKCAETEDSFTFYGTQISELAGSFSGKTLNGTYFELCTINSDAFVGSPDNACVGNVLMNVYADGHNIPTFGSLMINNRSIYLAVLGFYNDTLPTITTVDKFYILPYSFTLPKDMFC